MRQMANCLHQQQPPCLSHRHYCYLSAQCSATASKKFCPVDGCKKSFSTWLAPFVNLGASCPRANNITRVKVARAASTLLPRTLHKDLGFLPKTTPSFYLYLTSKPSISKTLYNTYICLPAFFFVIWLRKPWHQS